jgi:hypothetical protein
MHKEQVRKFYEVLWDAHDLVVMSMSCLPRRRSIHCGLIVPSGRHAPTVALVKRTVANVGVQAQIEDG